MFADTRTTVADGVQLRLAFEAAGISGKTNRSTTYESPRRVLIRSGGATALGMLSIMDDRLRFGASTGYASGDGDPTDFCSRASVRSVCIRAPLMQYSVCAPAIAELRLRASGCVVAIHNASPAGPDDLADTADLANLVSPANPTDPADPTDPAMGMQLHVGGTVAPMMTGSA